MELSKDFIRKQYLNIRKQGSSFDYFLLGWEIQNKFLNSDDYLNSKSIGVYYPTLNEVQTFRIVTKSLFDSKTVALPIVRDKTLSFHQYVSSKTLRVGPYNIIEPPVSDIPLDEKLDTFIVPGIAFDPRGYRIGYGKGYYDKFFNSKKASDLKKIGLAYDFQLLNNNIEANNYDVKLNALYTEKRIVNF